MEAGRTLVKRAWQMTLLGCTRCQNTHHSVPMYIFVHFLLVKPIYLQVFYHIAGFTRETFCEFHVSLVINKTVTHFSCQRFQETKRYHSYWPHTHTQVGDKVDARDLSMGAWFEAEVVKVTAEDTPTSKDDGPSSSTSSEPSSSTSSEPTLFYHVKFDE